MGAQGCDIAADRRISEGSIASASRGFCIRSPPNTEQKSNVILPRVSRPDGSSSDDTIAKKSWGSAVEIKSNQELQIIAAELVKIVR